jgi:hypothetical protein
MICNGLGNLTEAKVKSLVKLAFLLTLLAGAVQSGFSRGDKVIPQIVDGTDWATKFDLTNISRMQPITKMRIVFYKNDGSRWDLQTNRGTGEIQLSNLQPRQTIRIETLGKTPGGGYAVIYDEETLNSTYSEDFVLGISVFYVYSSTAGIADTVTVPVPQPTAAANIPLEMDDSKHIYSGLAIVNFSSAANSIKVDLYSEAGLLYGTNTLSLKANEQWAGYLDDDKLFPGLKSKSFKGMAQITSSSPIVLLGLLQTLAAGGSPQYATLVAVDREALRRNTYLMVLQFPDNSNPFLPIDLDGFTVDYSRTRGTSEDTETYSWDLEYRYTAPDPTARYLRPVAENGAAIASIGNKNGADFDLISLPDLKKLAYTTTSTIDLSDARGSSLYEGFTFAVHTELGNYAKVRILRIINTVIDTNPNYRDLVLEVCIYK